MIKDIGQYLFIPIAAKWMATETDYDHDDSKALK